MGALLAVLVVVAATALLVWFGSGRIRRAGPGGLARGLGVTDLEYVAAARVAEAGRSADEPRLQPAVVAYAERQLGAIRLQLRLSLPAALIGGALGARILLRGSPGQSGVLLGSAFLFQAAFWVVMSWYAVTRRRPRLERALARNR